MKDLGAPLPYMEDALFSHVFEGSAIFDLAHRPTVAVPGDDINPVLRLAGTTVALKR
jgi:hypothetical protein